MGVSDYIPSAASIKEGRAELTNLIKTNDQIATAENIPLKDLSSNEDVQDVVNTANNVETTVTSLIELPEVKKVRTQTEGLTFRELQGLDKALQSIRGELANNLAKLTDIDKDIAKEKRNIQEADDEIAKQDITTRLKNLEDD